MLIIKIFNYKPITSILSLRLQKQLNKRTDEISKGTGKFSTNFFRAKFSLELVLTTVSCYNLQLHSQNFSRKISENTQPPVPINANTNSSVNSSYCLPHPLMNVSYIMVQRPQNKETDTCFKLTMVSLQTCYCELVI